DARASLRFVLTKYRTKIEDFRRDRICLFIFPNPAIMDCARQVRPSKTIQEGEAEMSSKYIFVTGGVVSSLGKGLAAASIGCLLESRGLRINLMKFDPYLNVDPGTMSPFQHGEVFVTDDGAETDLDLGHY